MNAALDNGLVFSMFLDAVNSDEALQELSKLFPPELQPLFSVLSSEARIRILQNFVECTSETELNKALGVDGSKIDLFLKLADVFNIQNTNGAPYQILEGIVASHSYDRIEWVTKELLNTLQCVVNSENFVKFVRSEFAANGTLTEAAQYTRKCSTDKEPPTSLHSLLKNVANLINQTLIEWNIRGKGGKLLTIPLTALKHPLAACIISSFLKAYGFWTIANAIAGILNTLLNSAFTQFLLSGIVYVLKFPVGLIQKFFGHAIKSAIRDLFNYLAGQLLNKKSQGSPF